MFTDTVTWRRGKMPLVFGVCGQLLTRDSEVGQHAFNKEMLISRRISDPDIKKLLSGATVPYPSEIK